MSDITPPDLSKFSPELLAGYVLGDLIPSEIAIVEAYLAAHPEQQAEVASLMLPLDLLALTLPADNPPTSLRSQILEVATAESIVTAKSAKQLEVKSQQHWRSIKSIAAGLGLLLLAGLGWNNYQLSHELATVKQDLQIAKVAQQQKSQEYQSVVSLLPQPDNRYFSLKNMQGKGGVGSLVMVPNKSIALLALQKVEPLPPGQVYRVWAISGEEEMECAYFVPDANGKVLMQIPLKSWEKANKITITIEQKSATEPEGEIAIEGEI